VCEIESVFSGSHVDESKFVKVKELRRAVIVVV
jgi:hypothetical protein